jgi:hypothetical protein
MNNQAAIMSSFKSNSELFINQQEKTKSILSYLADYYKSLTWWESCLFFLLIIACAIITGLFLNALLPSVIITTFIYSVCVFLLLDHHQASEKNNLALHQAIQDYESELSTSVSHLNCVENGLQSTLETLETFNVEYSDQLVRLDTQNTVIEHQNSILINSASNANEVVKTVLSTAHQTQQLIDATEKNLSQLQAQITSSKTNEQADRLYKIAQHACNVLEKYELKTAHPTLLTP